MCLLVLFSVIWLLTFIKHLCLWLNFSNRFLVNVLKLHQSWVSTKSLHDKQWKTWELPTWIHYGGHLSPLVSHCREQASSLIVCRSVESTLSVYIYTLTCSTKEMFSKKWERKENKWSPTRRSSCIILSIHCTEGDGGSAWNVYVVLQWQGDLLPLPCRCVVLRCHKCSGRQM